MEIYFQKISNKGLAELIAEKDKSKLAHNSAKIYLSLCYNDFNLEELSNNALLTDKKEAVVSNLWQLLRYMQGYIVESYSCQACFDAFFKHQTNYSFYSKKFTAQGLRESPKSNEKKVIEKFRDMLSILDENGYGKWRTFKDAHKPDYLLKGMVRTVDDKINSLFDFSIISKSGNIKIFEDYGVFIEKNALKIFPVNADLLPDCLVHYGIEKSGIENKLVFDNLRNLKNLGIFGSPFFEKPIYFMRREFSPNLIGCSVSSKKDNYIKLIVDTKKLLNCRNIFIDPESLSGIYSEKEFKNTFLVLGGIPEESIIRIEKL